ncbi:hypothetical protein ACH49O_21190 [Streptomyces coeruleorubidus]|uniref:hypothetical protein n=1 Tax=Streptomyces coeruleorubidus TaxID=116188 RepID=UPI0033C42A29
MDHAREERVLSPPYQHAGRAARPELLGGQLVVAAPGECRASLTFTADVLDQGTWYVSAPATAKDGGTVFLPRAATFDLAH